MDDENDYLKEENEELKKRLEHEEKDNSCKNCGCERIGCGKDCFQ